MSVISAFFHKERQHREEDCIHPSKLVSMLCLTTANHYRAFLSGNLTPCVLAGSLAVALANEFEDNAVMDESIHDSACGNGRDILRQIDRQERARRASSRIPEGMRRDDATA